MIDNKLSLTFILPGSTMMSSQECEKNPKKSYITHKIMMPHSIRGKRMKPIYKPMFIQTRGFRNASQHINMSTEAYLYMLNTPTSAKLAKVVKINPKTGGTIRAWDLMTEHKRLCCHLDMIANDLHAISYSYEILED